MAAVERVYLAGWFPTRRTAALKGRHDFADGEEALEELAELAGSAGARVVGSVLQRSPDPDPATLIGRGKVEELRIAAREAGADCVIFTRDLSPTQLRNLEDALGLRVIDRTQLILDIFARRARTREGKLQVELAQLNYLLPRLAGRETRLSRLGGGIGTRGPGEQKLETDRRRIRARIQKLTDALDHVRSQRALHRERRREQHFLNVALVGYTNAGKSTLFNTLVGAGALTSPRLFATLDPAVRALRLESRRKALLSDTVGFIRDLPPHLVASFRATLEELHSADLLLHVTDASNPEHEERDRAVERLLGEIGVAAAPRLHVWNKIDLIPEQGLHRIRSSPLDVAVSAKTGWGIQELLRRIDEALVRDPVVEADFDLPSTDSKGLALLYRSGTVLSKRFTDHRVLVRARVPESVRARLALAPPDSALGPSQ
ncbi:MAG TPA: GTPase HflX [Terriglobia bacterium]|nr:GTPase HflX [Terriglobia bacterium]